jgi:tetratricopeptide (TPR) repeat protein
MPENVGAPLLPADGALASGDFDTAARLFADAEAATPERDAQAQARHGQACALRAAGDYAAAYALADRALSLLPTGSRGALWVRSKFYAPTACVNSVNPRWLNASFGWPRRPSIGSSFRWSATKLESDSGGVWPEAATVFEVLTKSRHPLVRSQAMNNLAIMRERAGEFAASVELLKRELVLAREIDDQHGQVVTQINLRVLLAAGRREEARDVTFAALALADRAPVSSALKEQAAQAVAAAR